MGRAVRCGHRRNFIWEVSWLYNSANYWLLKWAIYANYLLLTQSCACATVRVARYWPRYPRAELSAGRVVRESFWPNRNKFELSVNRRCKSDEQKQVNDNVAKICAQNRTCLFPTHDVRILPAQLTWRQTLQKADLTKRWNDSGGNGSKSKETG